ncbi:DUF3300 domain-containing protein [Aquipseudomonas guryensis]|uniref:DUF3300 domain-containing protein n=1 Tax=Aquipseudomonas guryensis TaxID=2759165 RepID=A0A7W4DBA0_9GAMM|nr:DUF3300 domain-containing protein [Pseudomonas guryensis]MBB1519393.1 DUF3300 domain-containing protein [Pseudomonas guryensis]
MRVTHHCTILLAVMVLSGCPDEEAPPQAQTSAVAPVAPASGVSPPPAAAPATAAATANAIFTPEQLDQMLAPLALYPDALLAQVLMAATYPGDVADAVAWSKANPDSSGDIAVRAVAEQPWDPSVQSLVAFPAALVTLGQDPAWVQRVGDAFLADPNAVMDSVQRLRRQAQAAGNLESNEQQRVTEQPAAPAPTPAPNSSGEVVQQPAAPSTIIIEPAQPQVVYVPSYNPNVVYGTWPYPSQPVYYPPPPGYYFGGALATGLGFAAGVAIIDSLWGDCDWDNDDIDIDVDRYNNINSNRQINANQNNWQHNAVNRDGVPYRDPSSREKFNQRLPGSEQRDAFRGRDTVQTADRERARQSLQERGIETPATSNREARDRAQAATRELDRDPQARERLQGSTRDVSRDQARERAQASTRDAQARQQRAASNPQARQQVRQQQASTPRTRDNAFAGARNPEQARAQASRGQASRATASRPQASRASGQTVQRAPRASSRSGGGRRR